MIDQHLPETFYTTPDMVAEAMALPDPHDPLSRFKFSNISNPTYSYVCHMIKSNEDQIDFRTNRCWRVHYVMNDWIPIARFKSDENSYRFDYWKYGGNKLQLHKNVLDWNPEPVYSFKRDSRGDIDLEPASDGNGNPLYIHTRTGEKVYKNNGDPKIVREKAYRLTDGEYVPVENGYVFVEKYDGISLENEFEIPDSAKTDRMIYPGDRILLRSMNGDGWTEMPNQEQPSVLGGYNSFNIDHNGGVLFLRTHSPFNMYQDIKINYRWGADPDTTEVPYGIQRLCTLMTAKQILTSQFWVVKVGGGGEIAGVKEQLMREWDAEIAEILSSYQAPSTVYSMIDR